MYFDVYCDSGVKQKIRTSISHLFCEYFSIRRGFPMVSFVTEMIYLNANVNRLRKGLHIWISVTIKL